MKRLYATLLAAACLALGGVGAQAQDKYPSKPIKILVPYAPGGATDITTRIFGEQIHRKNVILENIVDDVFRHQLVTRPLLKGSGEDDGRNAEIDEILERFASLCTR